MDNNKIIDITDVKNHLEFLQNIINRMANNSSSCKTWCITIISAMLVVFAENSKPNVMTITYIPTILFLLLDAYYLGLEKGFRNSYDELVDNIHDDKLEIKDIYRIKIKGNIFRLTFDAFRSPSVWPFYLVIATTIFASKYIIN